MVIYDYISMVTVTYGHLLLSMVTYGYLCLPMVTYAYLWLSQFVEKNTVPQSSRTQTEHFELWHCGTEKGNSVQNG